MKITDYEELENDYKIGYAENGFVVYGMISKQNTTGFTRSEILQDCYKQVRDAVLYENDRIADGKSVSIPYVEKAEDLDFVPEVPHVSSITISGLTVYSIFDEAIDAEYSAVLLDQYGDSINESLTWKTSNGIEITNGELTIDVVEEQTDFSITATSLNGVSGAINIIVIPKFAPTLSEVKATRIAEFKDMEESKLKTFQSSALGAAHTYLSELTDMVLLSGQYSYVKGDDYSGEAISWYTIENGNLSHTKEQFIQIYLDARANVQTVKYHRATLEYQVNACATISEVDALTW